MSSAENFGALGIPAQMLPVLQSLGYEVPSPVQHQAIPLLMVGKDLIAQAQTGTGKTGAFALPILASLSIKDQHPQAIVLAPTRELAIQVAEAFQSYARDIPGFHVLPIYGGQEIGSQLRALKRGVHVVVGTPGRVMDHLRRKTLSLAKIKTIVLDEADEMLKMGFLEDVEWILEQIPGEHQTALFSATMPEKVQRIAKKYLQNASKIQIQSSQQNTPSITQRYVFVANKNKLNALTRFLEIEESDATLIFARTKQATVDLAEKLLARGYAAAAINGDMQQSMREKVIERLKKGELDIVIATDVAARGLDVERITHVINYDVPYDAESYVHRIGRTGRAGRAGVALLFITPREEYVLRDIERSTQQRIEAIEVPSVNQLDEKRAEKFSANLMSILSNKDLDRSRAFVEHVAHENECSILDIAAALHFLSQPKRDKEIPKEVSESEGRGRRNDRRRGGGERRRQGERRFGERRHEDSPPLNNDRRKGGDRRHSDEGEKRGPRRKDDRRGGDSSRSSGQPNRSPRKPGDKGARKRRK